VSSEVASTGVEPPWQEVQRRALYFGAGGLVLLTLVATFNLRCVLHSYLVAYLFWLGVGLGCLALLMVQHLTGGAWGLVIRRILEAGTRTLPYLAVFFLPVLFGMHELYSWSRPAEVAADPELAKKVPYLNVTFFMVRAAFYFAVWLGAAFLLNRWSKQQDDTADPRLAGKFQTISGPGLLLYGLTVTFASVDWAMSLEPHWFSTIYGVLFGMGQVLSAMALSVAVLAALASLPPFAGVVSASHFRDLGGMLLAFVMLWAYMALSQFLLIWSGNLPEEIPWYRSRLEGGWKMIGILLIVFHFALPFLLLLSRTVKETPRMLGAVAIVMLVMRMVDMMWMIVPAYSHGSGAKEVEAHFAAMDILSSIVALVGLGGIWLWLFFIELRKRPLLPVRDPAFAELTSHE